MTISALPVNSSAPPTMTRISPTEKAMPPTSLAGPKSRPLPEDQCVEHCSKGDEGAGQHRQRHKRHGREPGLANAGFFDARRDFSRSVGIDTGRIGRRTLL